MGESSVCVCALVRRPLMVTLRLISVLAPPAGRPATFLLPPADLAPGFDTPLPQSCIAALPAIVGYDFVYTTTITRSGESPLGPDTALISRIEPRAMRLNGTAVDHRGDAGHVGQGRGGEQAEDDGEGARRGHTDNDRAYVLDAPANALVNWNVHFLILESGIL